MGHITTLILAWFGIAVAVLAGWWWLAILGILISTMLRGSLGVLCVAILLDGYYGALPLVPWLTLCALGWFIVTDWLQERLIIAEAKNV